MVFGTRVQFNPIGTVAFGSITGSYTAFGPPMPGHVRLLRLSNSTNQDILVSADGTTNHLRVSAGGFILFDFVANEVQNDGFFVTEKTQFYLKYVSAPSSGAAWIEVITASGGE